jgi:hypothetical protein
MHDYYGKSSMGGVMKEQREVLIRWKIVPQEYDKK